MPFWHVSVTVQNAPSSQVVPLPTAGKTQPLAGLQEFVVQTLLSSHARAGPGVQPPEPLQVSPLVQALLSVHVPPAGVGGNWQPAIGSQVSWVQTLLSVHVSGVPDAQEPLLHVSAPLQTFASAHEVPFGTAGKVQPVVGLQLFVVHGRPSSQVRGPPGVQAPMPLHVSPVVQALPSVHAPPAATGGF
jgi:hypothetical protein